MKVSFAQSPAEGNQALQRLYGLLPGLLVCGIVALAARFLSDSFGLPAMLVSLLLGIGLGFLTEEARTAGGIAFSAKSLLRLSVALLGMRITLDLLIELGPALLGLVVAGVICTILFGLAIGRILNRGWRISVLTASAVAICGASAAVAVAAVLPKNRSSERNLTFTVMCVTLLSTTTMVVYPFIARAFGFDEATAGVFLGGSIHDVAGVVGAGFSMSQKTGDMATLVKLIRVSMLAPVVIALTVLLRDKHAEGEESGGKSPLIPTFVIAFLVLAVLRCLHLIPDPVVEVTTAASKWGLLAAIAAVGMKTSLRDIRNIGRTAVILILAETAFLFLFIVGGIHLLL